MKLFRKRLGPAQNLAFVGLMCAVEAVLATLSTLLPLSSLLVIIFLPLVSALTVIVCEDKYILIYLVAAIGLSLGVTAYDIAETLFYIIPATIVGTFYGFLLKKGLPSAYLIFLCALAETGLNYAALPIIKLISGQDFMILLLTMLGITNEPIVPYLIFSFVFVYSLMEVVLSHVFGMPLLHSFGIKIHNCESVSWLYEVLAILFSALAISLAFANISLGYFFLSAGIFFLAFSFLTFARKLPWWTYVFLAGMGMGGWVIFVCLYPFMPTFTGMILLGVLTISFAIPCLMVRLLFKVTEPVTGSSNGKVS